MTERFTLDSNILVYAADARDSARQESAVRIIIAAARRDCALVPQALAEFYHSVTRKRILPPGEAAEQVRDWTMFLPVALGPTAGGVLAAAEAHLAGRFQFYDALLLATAGTAGCTAVISEDMADGARLGGVRVVAAFDAAGGISAGALALVGSK